jgi:CheY-like chemotaxis protein
MPNNVLLSPALHVLLVDDDEGDAFIIEDLLEEIESDIQLSRVSDGLEAMAFLQQNPPYQTAKIPDLILLDLNMPRMDGRQVLKAIRENQSLCHLPVVILTTSDARFDINHSYLEGGNCYIIKPSGIHKLMSMLKNMSHFWGQIAQLPKPSFGSRSVPSPSLDSSEP